MVSMLAIACATQALEVGVFRNFMVDRASGGVAETKGVGILL